MISNEEREKLITDNMRLVYYLISRYYPNCISNEDVIQEGMLGLVQAADNWDETKSKFSTYASIRILGSVRDYFKKEKKHIETVSIDEVCHTDELGHKLTIMDTIVGEDDMNFTNACLAEFYQSLDEVDRTILELNMQGYIYSEITQHVNLSINQVGRRIKKLRQKWREFYENNK